MECDKHMTKAKKQADLFLVMCGANRKRVWLGYIKKIVLCSDLMGYIPKARTKDEKRKRCYYT